MARFGPFHIVDAHIFHRSALSFAFVNLRPVVKGHVLVSPLRCVSRLKDLKTEEVTDLFQTARNVSSVVETTFEGTSITLSVQDGSEAGQTVPHVHVHILPRRKRDFERNDDIYLDIDTEENELQKALDDDRRQNRTHEEMEEEALLLRQRMEKFLRSEKDQAAA